MLLMQNTLDFDLFKCAIQENKKKHRKIIIDNKYRRARRAIHGIYKIHIVLLHRCSSLLNNSGHCKYKFRTFTLPAVTKA